MTKAKQIAALIERVEAAEGMSRKIGLVAAYLCALLEQEREQ